MKKFMVLPHHAGELKKGALFSKSVDGPLKSCVPGEWIWVIDKKETVSYIAYVNIFAQQGPVIRLVEECSENLEMSDEAERAVMIIERNIIRACERRAVLKCYQEGKRLVYGAADNLPGLVVDEYENAILIQINTAGMDRFRPQIQNKFQALFAGKRIYFWDNKEAREQESLPAVSDTSLDAQLQVRENQFRLQLPMPIIQKVGYYYDHRENRGKLEQKIHELNLEFKTGLDLFCYAGSWGLHMLRAGVETVDFVDQADLNETILENIQINGFGGRGKFYHHDVFKFLDEKIKEGRRYSIIVSDPPAFSKTSKNIGNALGGYRRLHRKIIKLLNPNSLLAIASCTKGVGPEDLAQTVLDGLNINGRRAQIIDIGIQGIDHPFTSFDDNNYYLKYILYWVE